MPKTIESRSLSAPPAHHLSPKNTQRSAHPLSTQVFTASDPPASYQKLPLKHSWRRQWSKDPYLKRNEKPNMHVVLDASMSVTAVQITKPSTRQPSLSSDRTITPEPAATAQSQSEPPRGSSEASIADA